jgi:carbon starvation protein
VVKPAGLALWTLFGGTNQMIAGLALLTAAVHLRQLGRTAWPLAVPAVGMLVLTLFSLGLKIRDFHEQGLGLLLALAVVLVLIGLGVSATALLALRRPQSSDGAAAGA